VPVSHKRGRRKRAVTVRDDENRSGARPGKRVRHRNLVPKDESDSAWGMFEPARRLLWKTPFRTKTPKENQDQRKAGNNNILRFMILPALAGMVNLQRGLHRTETLSPKRAHRKEKMQLQDGIGGWWGEEKFDVLKMFGAPRESKNGRGGNGTGYRAGGEFEPKKSTEQESAAKNKGSMPCYEGRRPISLHKQQRLIAL